MINLIFYRNLSRICKRYYSQEIKMSYPKRVFSAIQPTGDIHLGNYLGAIKSWIELQEKENCVFNIADLHSITVSQDPTRLHENIMLMTATLLSCGLDVKKCLFYKQSDVPQHAELSWILGTLGTMARLSRLPQFKEKTESMKFVPLGIFLYPVLQAADIALYKTTHVPVGEDQAQHIQMTNELTGSFNARFGETFPHVQIMLDKKACSIKSLIDPQKKMSKSDSSKSHINLTDSPDDILMKCKKAVTDCESRVYYDSLTRPGISNLLTIHSCLTNESFESIAESYSHLDTGKYKIVLAEIITETLKPIREEINRLMNSKDYLTSILQSGAEKAREKAEATLEEVKQKVGLNRS